MCVQAEYAPQSARVPLTTHCIGVSSLVEKLAQALLMQPIICKSIHILYDVHLKSKICAYWTSGTLWAFC